MNNNSSLEDIRKLVERFAISYDVFPESAVLRDHAIRQVGYVVNLYGDDERDRPLHPGDERCGEVIRGLYRVARWVIPPDERACHIDINGANDSLHYLQSGKERGLLQVEIHVLHGDALDASLDADEKRALEELIGRLESLGVCSLSRRRR